MGLDLCGTEKWWGEKWGASWVTPALQSKLPRLGFAGAAAAAGRGDPPGPAPTEGGGQEEGPGGEGAPGPEGSYSGEGQPAPHGGLGAQAGPCVLGAPFAPFLEPLDVGPPSPAGALLTGVP